jgi:hypothetical protein
LPELDAAALERDGGYLGWVLRLVQQRKSRPKEFLQLMERVVAHLGAMGPAEGQRLADLLFYIGALVYHERSESEHAILQQVIESSVQDEGLRQEVSEMGKTMADVLTEKGRLEGERKGRNEAAVEARQQTLVRLLRKRFGHIPPGMVSAVKATTDVDQLDEWLDRFATARTLDELEISAAR